MALARLVRHRRVALGVRPPRCDSRSPPGLWRTNQCLAPRQVSIAALRVAVTEQRDSAPLLAWRSRDLADLRRARAPAVRLSPGRRDTDVPGHRIRHNRVVVAIRRLRCGGSLGLVIGVLSRRVLSWQVSSSLRTGLALDGIKMGAGDPRARGQGRHGGTSHSDRGAQHLALSCAQQLAAAPAPSLVGLTDDNYQRAGRGVQLACSRPSWFAARALESMDDFEIAAPEYIDGFKHRAATDPRRRLR